ncbi:MAG: DUF2339 domain-containing protein [Pirellulales bacterium]
MPNIAELLMVFVVGIFLLAALVGGPILALIAYFRTRQVSELVRRLQALEVEVLRLRTARPVESASPAAAATPVEPRQPTTQPAAPATSAENKPTAAPQPATAESDLIADAIVIEDASSPTTSDIGRSVSPAAAAEPGRRAWAPPPAPAASPATATSARSTPAPTAGDAISLEMLIGRQALGWVAVITLLFATGFFLKYAYENEWIGPIGRVSIGLMFGLALVIAGWRKDRQGWRLFSRMLTSGGIVVLYASIFSAFGFYDLIPRNTIGVLLTIVVAESMLLAIGYRSLGIALMAVLGGFITPLLLHSDHDQYVSLFTYLTLLTAGSLAAATFRRWSLLGTLTLLGAQLVFWLWFFANYHPEKMVAALLFQGCLFVLHRVQSVWMATTPSGDTLWDELRVWEEQLRSAICAGLGFLAVLALLEDRHSDWRGTAAVIFAGAYALEARVLMASRTASRSLLLFAVVLTTGFITLALPLQASTSWVSLGWSAMASALWWFGWRVERWQLRGLAAALGTLALGRLALVDIPRLSWDHAARGPYTPVINLAAAPALVAIVFILAVLVISRRRMSRGSELERFAAGAGVVACFCMICYLVSVDLYEWFRPVLAAQQGFDFSDPTRWASELEWRRRASMWLSIWWGVYATCLLAIGFAARARLSRWTALGLLAITLSKVFLVDMAALDQIYRIAAFFALALVLGIAAWAYQRFGATRGQES